MDLEEESQENLRSRKQILKSPNEVCKSPAEFLACLKKSRRDLKGF